MCEGRRVCGSVEGCREGGGSVVGCIVSPSSEPKQHAVRIICIPRVATWNAADPVQSAAESDMREGVNQGGSPLYMRAPMFLILSHISLLYIHFSV